MDFPLRRKISQVTPKNHSSYFNFWCINILLLYYHLRTEMSSTLLGSPLGPKKTGHFHDGICGAVQMFFSEKNHLQNGHIKNTHKLLLKRKPLELFNSIHIFGRGGNHLCIDELGQRNKTTSVAMDLYVLPPRLILKKSGKDSGCVLLMINEGTALLHQKRRLVLIHQIHHSCAWKM